jgi:hypothetical protein
MVPVTISCRILVAGLVVLALLSLISPISGRTISAGDTISINETGLDISAAVGNISKSYLSNVTDTTGSDPEPVIQIYNIRSRTVDCRIPSSSLHDFYADPACFTNKTGQWTVLRPAHPWECKDTGEGCNIIFTVVDPPTPTPAPTTPPLPMETATTVKTPVVIPTSWPTTPAKSPVGIEILVIAIAGAALLAVLRK